MKLKIIILGLMVSLLAFLSYGTVKEFGKDLGYPAQSAFSIMSNEQNIDNTRIFDSVQNIAEKYDLTIYKSFLNDHDDYHTFAFGNHVDKKYITDITQLKNSLANGMYYVDKNMPQEALTTIKQLGVEVKSGEFGWYLIPIYFLFQTVRAWAVWTIFFIFGSILLAFKMLYRKKMMIYRSIGQFNRWIKKDILEDVVLLSVFSTGIISISLLKQQGYDNVFFKSFTTLILTNFIIMLTIIMIVNLLMVINIKLSNILSIIKNMKMSRIIVFTWLVAIMVSVYISNIAISQSIDLIKASDSQIKVLNNWTPVKNYLSITWQANNKINANGQIDGASLKIQDDKLKKFLELVGEENYVYSQASNLNNKYLEIMPEPLIKDLQDKGVNTDLAGHIYYVNQGFINKNKILYPNQMYVNENKVSQGVMYIPEQYKNQIDDIKNIINYEYFGQGKEKIDFSVEIVPNNQKIFLFNYRLSENELFAKQQVTDVIIVQLNMSELFKSEAAHTIINNVSFSALYDKTVLKESLQQSDITNYSGFTNVSELMLIEKEKIENQLFGTIIALIMLGIVQIFIVYQYITILIKNNAKRLAVLNFLGQSIWLHLIKLILPLLIGIACVNMILIAQAISINVLLLLSAFYFVEIIFISLIALYNFKKKQVQILKGDFEVL